MSQSLTLELSEQVFVAIQRQAQVIGISPAQLAATLLERQFSQAFKLLLDEAEKNAARARFEAKVEVFTADPFDPSLRTHKLSGKLKDRLLNPCCLSNVDLCLASQLSVKS